MYHEGPIEGLEAKNSDIHFVSEQQEQAIFSLDPYIIQNEYKQPKVAPIHWFTPLSKKQS